MHDSSYAILAKRRFLPLFVSLFLGAFNDNFYKNALVMLITFKLASSGREAEMLIMLGTALFVLPFFLFSALAGQLADKYEKSLLIKIVKFAEILLMCGALAGLLTNNLILLLFVLFLVGTHAAFFGPLKYSILPHHLHPDEIVTGNGFVEAGTFVAILLGTVAGGQLIMVDFIGGAVVSAVAIAIACIGFAVSLFVPLAPASRPELKIRYNVFAETWNIISYTRQNRDVFAAVIAISWFWLMGATLLSLLPVLTKEHFGGDEFIVNLFFTLFSMGIALGSIVCSRLSKGTLSVKYVPLAAIGMTVFLIDLVLVSKTLHHPANLPLMGFYEFITNEHHKFECWRAIIDTFMMAFCGGIFTVPLYVVVQVKSDPGHRARVVASNNVMNSFFMVVASTIIIGLLKLEVILKAIAPDLATSISSTFFFTTTDILLILGILNIGIAIHSRKLCRKPS